MNAARKYVLSQRCLCRAYSSESDVLKLSSTVFTLNEPPSVARAPVVFLHGLFGSKRNAATVCRNIAQETGRGIHCLDLRNHGESPHSSVMTYKAMARDVSGYLEQEGIESAVLMGHSMGGKTAMTVALDPASRDKVERLVVVDMTPAKGGVQTEFSRYIRAMRQVTTAKATTRKACNKVLQQTVKSDQIRMFLMTNWPKRSDSDEHEWRIPLDILEASFEEIGSFPYQPGDCTFEKPTLFIKGQKSSYINHKTQDVAQTFFPQMQLEIVKDASHWVHGDKPQEFKKLIVDFCGQA